MTLQDEMIKSGNWLFRRRSYLPLLLFGIVLLAFRQYQYLGRSHQEDLFWELICLALSFFGLAVRIYTVGYSPQGTSGRNTQKQIARTLNTTGAYSLVRHPLYLGNFFIWLGVAMFVHDLSVCWIIMLIFWLYYERIICAEEAFLSERFGEQYLLWARQTPAFVPSIGHWRRPEGRFSVRKVLRKEYSGLFGIVASFFALEMIGDYVVNGRIVLDPYWLVLFAGGAVIYLILRTLKKKTRWLQETGR